MRDGGNANATSLASTNGSAATSNASASGGVGGGIDFGGAGGGADASSTAINGSGLATSSASASGGSGGSGGGIDYGPGGTGGEASADSVAESGPFATSTATANGGQGGSGGGVFGFGGGTGGAAATANSTAKSSGAGTATSLASATGGAGGDAVFGDVGGWCRQGHCGALTPQSGSAPSPLFWECTAVLVPSTAQRRGAPLRCAPFGVTSTARGALPGQVGTKGWSSRSNQGMGPRSGSGGLGGMFRVEGGLGFKHGASDSEEPIGDAAQGAAMAMTRACAIPRSGRGCAHRAGWRRGPNDRRRCAAADGRLDA